MRTGYIGTSWFRLWMLNREGETGKPTCWDVICKYTAFLLLMEYAPIFSFKSPFKLTDSWLNARRSGRYCYACYCFFPTLCHLALETLNITAIGDENQPLWIYISFSYHHHREYKTGGTDKWSYVHIIWWNLFLSFFLIVDTASFSILSHSIATLRDLYSCMQTIFFHNYIYNTPTPPPPSGGRGTRSKVTKKECGSRIQIVSSRAKKDNATDATLKSRGKRWGKKTRTCNWAEFWVTSWRWCCLYTLYILNQIEALCSLQCQSLTLQLGQWALAVTLP